MEPTDQLLGLRASTSELVRSLTECGWTDADVAAETLCPGWTRGHLLTHIARNGDGIAGTLAGTLRGEIVQQYPGGAAQRAADIDAGAARPFSVLLADVRDSADRLDRVLGAVTDADAWERPSGSDIPAHDWVGRRWTEVEIHRVDLAYGYESDQWPPLLIASLLGEVAPSVDERAAFPVRVRVTSGSSGAVGSSFGAADGTLVEDSDWAVLAWLLGRPSPVTDGAPELAPWR